VKNKVISFALLALFLCAFISTAQAEDVQPSYENKKARLELPVVEAPFNFSNGYQFPGMHQSLQISNDFYLSVHKSLQDAFGPEHQFGGRLSVAAFDVLSEWLPLGDGWMHEEWHRAVLTNHRIGSYNDVYDWRVFSPTIAVSHVRDEDLVRLKNESPADMVRLQEAGLESQNEQNFSIEKQHFFNQTNTFDQVLLWSNALNNTFYLYTCSGNDANTMTDTQNSEDGSNIPKRDFTGLDCTGWAYDLHRPLEPYAARGVHPSGNGINRYRKFSDLRAGEQSYLKTQTALSLINFADPFLLGYDSFYMEVPLTKEGLKWNVNAKHYMTSFGHSIDLNFFLKSYERSCIVTWHHYFNGVSYFPGIQVDIIRVPVELSNKTLYFTPTFGGWYQPDGQRFHNPTGKPGGVFGLRTDYPLSEKLETYLELQQKSEGWLAGDVDLEPSFQTIAGLTFDM
jgi:hypothetical protein